MEKTLGEREKAVIEAVIEDYIQTAEPVGSRTVAKILKMALSPATIRNVMADLEESGFLMQPHTSAGRVPTDKAFRYYVDRLLEIRRLSRLSRDRIDSSLQIEKMDITEILRRASTLLSSLSKQTGVVLGPRFDSTVFKHVEFIRVSEKRVLVVLVSTMGEVQNKIIEVDESMTQDELDQYSRYLTEIMGGLTLAEAKGRIMEEMKQERVLFDRLMFRALQLSQKALEGLGEGDIYIEGKTNIIRSPEFSDLEKMRLLFLAFEEKGKLVKLLDKALSASGIQIFIGEENELREMKSCSVIAARYAKESSVLGTVGVIGPTRMDYCTIIPLVDYTARMVSKMLDHIDR
jgi:heat-inducible transcriptional repressor